MLVKSDAAISLPCDQRLLKNTTTTPIGAT